MARTYNETYADVPAPLPADVSTTWRVTHYGPDGTFHGQLETLAEERIEQIASHPDRVALSGQGETNPGQRRISWHTFIDHRDKNGNVTATWQRTV